MNDKKYLNENYFCYGVEIPKRFDNLKDAKKNLKNIKQIIDRLIIKEPEVSYLLGISHTKCDDAYIDYIHTKKKRKAKKIYTRS